MHCFSRIYLHTVYNRCSSARGVWAGYPDSTKTGRPTKIMTRAHTKSLVSIAFHIPHPIVLWDIDLAQSNGTRIDTIVRGQRRHLHRSRKSPETPLLPRPSRRASPSVQFEAFLALPGLSFSITHSTGVLHPSAGAHEQLRICERLFSPTYHTASYPISTIN